MSVLKAPKCVQANQDIREAWAQTQVSLQKIGFDYGVCCYLSSAKKNSFEAICTENASEWAKYHLSNNCASYDPVPKSGQSKTITVWNNIPIEKNNILVQKVMNDRRDYGMRSGVTVPIINKFGKLTTWFSLSIKGNDDHLESIINKPTFEEDILDLHISTASKTLSKLTKTDYYICYAIVLSSYTSDKRMISAKTGIMESDLINLFGNLFFYKHSLDFFSLDIKQETIDILKKLTNDFPSNTSKIPNFSKRQLDCLKTMMEGSTAKEAGKKLNISPRTYQDYIAILLDRFDCRNQKELTYKISLEKELKLYILSHKIAQ